MQKARQMEAQARKEAAEDKIALEKAKGKILPDNVAAELTRQHQPRNSGSRLGRSIWTDEACQKASAGEFLYWQRTGACHAPVNAITQEGGVGPGSGEVQRNPVRRRKPPAGRKGIF